MPPAGNRSIAAKVGILVVPLESARIVLMEPDEVRTWLRRSPIRIRMNSGDTYDVPSQEFAIVGDYSMSVLVRDNGRLLNKILALVNISEITEVEKSAQQSR
jgi:hypothetical protein